MTMTSYGQHQAANKIRVLPENLVNQIAAGEVVERPASVIKELVENAIDAGADRLKVDVELGGRRLMRVSDNGIGMRRDDAVLAFERHATSKIFTLEDLARIATLGFRGEALASIASVAKVELITGTEDDAAATLVQIEGGRLLDVRDAARDTGTTITVRDLFFNVPARRKFMRSEATENYHIASIVTHYALAHPEIAFALSSNGREVLRVSPARDLRERAYQLFGATLVESLVAVSGGRDLVARVTGFVSAPRERRTSRDSQYFFVNRRFVRDKTIAGGLLEGYRSILPHGVYPVAFLFVEIPVEEIDVNVHPAKTEIRFRRGEAVKDEIADAVRSALASAGIAPEETEGVSVGVAGEDVPEAMSLADEGQPAIDFTDAQSDTQMPAADPGSALPDRSQTTETPAIDVGPAAEFELAAEARQAPVPGFFDTSEVDAGTEGAGLIGPVSPALPPVNSALPMVRAEETALASGKHIEPVGQLHESFIIAVDDEGLLLVDQHVAHERILFDKFRRSEQGRAIESQNLLLPETLDLTPAQMVAFESVEGELAAFGFSVMLLSGRTIAIRSIPTDLPPGETRNFLSELLDAVEADRGGSAKLTFRDRIAAGLACRAAIKINMKLTNEKMRWLIDRLLKTSSPTTCPHGRPVILRLAMKDIERGFHRT